MINTQKRLYTGLAHFLQGSAKMLVAELPRCWWQQRRKFKRCPLQMLEESCVAPPDTIKPKDITKIL